LFRTRPCAKEEEPLLPLPEEEEDEEEAEEDDEECDLLPRWQGVMPRSPRYLSHVAYNRVAVLESGSPSHEVYFCFLTKRRMYNVIR
jgi:hypothetical protein